MSEAQRIVDEHNRRPACPVCGKRLVPLKSGKTRPHNRHLAIGTFWRFERCPGSGRPAKTK